MAEIDGGSLSFKSVLDNDQLNKAVDESLKRIQGLSDGTVAGINKVDDSFRLAESLVKNFSTITKNSGADIEAEYQKVSLGITSAFETVGSGIEQNQAAIRVLTAEYEKLGKEANKSGGAYSTKVGSSGYLTKEQSALIARIDLHRQAESELQKHDQALIKLNETLETHKKKLLTNNDEQKRLTTQQRLLINEMAKMEQAGQTNTEAYRKIAEEAGRLTDTLGDVRKQAQILGDDEATFRGLMSGLTGLSGGFSAVTGAVGLFSGESEALREIMLKVQSAMAITIGLQQVAETLNKDSYFRVKTLTQIQNIYAASIRTTGTAFIKMGASAGVARVAATALMGTLTLGLGVAITGIVTLISKWSEKNAEAKRKMEEFSNSVSGQISSLMTLSAKWKQLGNDINGQKKFLQENGDEIKKLTRHTLNLMQAEELFIKNTGKFVEALVMRARAEAKAKDVNTKVTELSTVNEQFDAEYEKLAKKGTMNAVDDETGKPMLVYTSQKYFELKKRMKDLKKETETLIEEQLKLSDKEKEILKNFGLDGVEALDGSIAKIQQSLINLRESYQKATSNKERSDLAKQIKEQERLLAKTDLLGDKANNKTKTEDPVLKEIEARKKAYSDYFRWVNAGFEKEAQVEFASLLENGKTYKDYLQSLLDEGRLTREQIRHVTNEIVGETNTSMLETFRASIAEQMNNAGGIIEQLRAIKEMRDDLKDDDPLKAQKIEVLDDENKKAEEMRKEEVENLKQQYADYAQQRLDIENKFNADKAAMYDKNGNLVAGITQAHLDEWQRQYTEALAGLDNEFSRTKTAIETLFGDMSKKSVEDMRAIAVQAQEMMDFITGGEWDGDKAALFGIKTEAQFKQLNEEWAQSPEKLAAIKKAIQELLDEADKSETAFNRMSAGLRKVFSASGQADLQAGLDMVASGLSSVTEMGNMFADSLRNIGEMAGSDVFTGIANGLSQVMDVANSTMQGAQAGSAFGPAGAIVGATLGLVSSMTSIFAENKKVRDELKKQIAENNDTAYFGEFEVNRLYRERYEWAQKIGETQLSYIKRNGEELKKQTSENAKDQNELWGKLLGTKYKAGEHFESTGLFGWGKGKIVTDWASLAGKTWEEIEMLAGQGKLSEEGQKYYEALKAAKEEGEDLAARQEEYLEHVRETFTGSTYDSVVNGIVDGFKAGKRSAADFADTFEDLMQGAMASALRMAADDKTREFYEEFAARSSDADGLTEDDIEYLNGLWNSIINSLSEETANLEKVTGRKFGDSTDSAASLSGAVKGVTEETASLVAGQTNAMRINQMEATALLRQQLFHLANIDRNTGAIDSNTQYNRYIKDIYDKMSTGDSLRSQGLS